MANISYRLVRSDRKTISIQIADGGVLVRAPRQAPADVVDRFVQSKRSWIEKHLAQVPAPKPKLSEAEIRSLANQAMTAIPARVRHYAPIVGVSYGRITIRNQHTRWGSCSSKGNLNFNCLLMLAPQHVIDYVVVHELCHRLEMNHSDRFWAQVARVLPGYQTSRDWLKAHGAELIARM